MVGWEWRAAEPSPGEVERKRAEVAAGPDVAIDEAALTAPAVLPAPTGSASLVLAPGEPAVLRSKVPHDGCYVVVSDEEVVLVDGGRRHRCARPGHARPGGPPLLDRLVSVIVHHRAIGALHEGHRFVYAIGGDDRLLGSVDGSKVRPFRRDHLEAMCALAGVGHEERIFETVDDLVAAVPGWAAPVLEFEIHHPHQEVAREWGKLISCLFLGVAVLGGGICAFYVTRVGIALRAAIGVAFIVFGFLTLWSRSRRRMRRSLRRRAQRRARPAPPP